MRFVETEGGPFVVIPRALGDHWGDDEDYGRARRVSLAADVLTCGSGQALILSSCEIATFYPTARGGIFAQRIWGDATKIVAAIARLGTAGWLPLPGRFTIATEELVMFDAAHALKSAATGAVLDFALASGTYSLARRTLQTHEDDSVNLILVKLTRA